MRVLIVILVLMMLPAMMVMLLLLLLLLLRAQIRASLAVIVSLRWQWQPVECRPCWLPARWCLGLVHQKVHLVVESSHGRLSVFERPVLVFHSDSPTQLVARVCSRGCWLCAQPLPDVRIGT